MTIRLSVPYALGCRFQLETLGPNSERRPGQCHRFPQHKVVYGKVKAGPVVGTAAGDVLQNKDVPGAEQLRVQHAPNMQREKDPVREVRGRVHDGIWVTRNTHRRTPEPVFRNRCARANKAGAGGSATPVAVRIVR